MFRNFPENSTIVLNVEELVTIIVRAFDQYTALPCEDAGFVP